MGTYKITPTSTASGVLSYRDQSNILHNTTPDSSVINNITSGAWIPNGVMYNLLSGFPGAQSGSITCTPNDNAIYLDGSSTPTNINSLPVGFNVTSAKYTPGITSPLTTNTTESNVGAQTASPAAVINYNSSLVSLNDVLATQFGVIWTINDANNGEIDTSSQLITGNYNIISTQWTIINLTRPGATNFAAGEHGKLYNSYTHFDTITSIQVRKVDGTILKIPSSDFIDQTPLFIIFPIPDNPGSPGDMPTISPVDNGTNFIGSALAGSITIVVIDRSGLYLGSDSLRYDTVYVNSGTDATTENLAIPQPFFKTGFIGG
jgi:hypothetical protein